LGARCASPFNSPATVLSGYRINTSRRAAAISPKRDRSLVTAFSSPAKISACANSFHRVSGPGLLLRSLAGRFSCPFGSSAPPPVAGSPQLPAASTPQTRCILNPARFAGCAARLRSPSGVFAPSGSTHQLASQPFGPPSGIARSSFAPRSLSF